MSASPKELPDGAGLVLLDPWLEPYTGKLASRQGFYRKALQRFDDTGGLLGQISQGHHIFGLNCGELYGNLGVLYRELAQGALLQRVNEEFNDWNHWSRPISLDEFGFRILLFP